MASWRKTASSTLHGRAALFWHRSNVGAGRRRGGREEMAELVMGGVVHARGIRSPAARPGSSSARAGRLATLGNMHVHARVIL
jgi:hypothetical protein